MEGIPRILSVAAISDTELLVGFEGGVEKVYDCTRLLSRPQFALLKTPAFFRAVRADPGGYGISWNDELDLSEYELWTNGETTEGEPRHRPDATAYPRETQAEPAVADAPRHRQPGK